MVNAHCLPFTNIGALGSFPTCAEITAHVLAGLQPGPLSNLLGTGSGAEVPKLAKMLKELYDLIGRDSYV